jgi:MPBQ/MSBQ methyltransferase
VKTEFIDNLTRQEVEDYLIKLYTGVFTSEAISSHLENHVGFAFAEYATQVVAPRLKFGAKLLDIGSGFGSCVLAARNSGLDAIGLEIAPFEVKFARERLKKARPQDDPQSVYLCGDAHDVNLSPETLDAVTLWNVLEHIHDCESILQKAVRLLKPGGIMFIICPNYMAWRQEAHYHVPWKPSFLFPKEKGAAYLRALGRDTSFFESSIHYRTNWEVLDLLKQLGMEVRDLGTFENRSVSFRRMPALICQPIRHLKFHNPFRHSVEVAARKV